MGSGTRWRQFLAAWTVVVGVAAAISAVHTTAGEELAALTTSDGSGDTTIAPTTVDDAPTASPSTTVTPTTTSPASGPTFRAVASTRNSGTLAGYDLHGEDCAGHAMVYPTSDPDEVDAAYQSPGGSWSYFVPVARSATTEWGALCLPFDGERIDPGVEPLFRYEPLTLPPSGAR